MKFDHLAFKGPLFNKQQFLEQLQRDPKTLYYRSLLTPGEASKITFTSSGTSLHIDGPRELIERLARKLKRLGAKAGPETP
jgi:hypothetical protein